MPKFLVEIDEMVLVDRRDDPYFSNRFSFKGGTLVKRKSITVRCLRRLLRRLRDIDGYEVCRRLRAVS